MVRVGDDLCKYLNDMGINTIHDTQIHDDNYTGAYKHSRKSVLKYLEEYPSIDITIDVHRDDITYENKTKVKPSAGWHPEICLKHSFLYSPIFSPVAFGQTAVQNARGHSSWKGFLLSFTVIPFAKDSGSNPY